MPSFYQVYNVDPVLELDFDRSAPTTLNDAFGKTAQLEAQDWLLYNDCEIGSYQTNDRDMYVVQPSPWGFEESFNNV
jgi:hypothetical protein